MKNSEVTYYKSAEWANLVGNFTPSELREIADKIEADYKEFQDNQKG